MCVCVFMYVNVCVMKAEWCLENIDYFTVTDKKSQSNSEGISLCGAQWETLSSQ